MPIPRPSVRPTHGSGNTGGRWRWRGGGRGGFGFGIGAARAAATRSFGLERRDTAWCRRRSAAPDSDWMGEMRRPTDRPIGRGREGGRGKKEGEDEEEGKAQFEPEVDDLSLIS